MAHASLLHNDHSNSIIWHGIMKPFRMICHGLIDIEVMNIVLHWMIGNSFLLYIEWKWERQHRRRKRKLIRICLISAKWLTSLICMHATGMATKYASVSINRSISSHENKISLSLFCVCVLLLYGCMSSGSLQCVHTNEKKTQRMLRSVHYKYCLLLEVPPLATKSPKELCLYVYECVAHCKSIIKSLSTLTS